MIDQPRGYMLGAPVYRAVGWEGVCPLPEGKKLPPPVGFSGWAGEYPDDAQIAAWCQDPVCRHGNLMLRMSPGFLAFDVDAYGDKTGGLTMTEGERVYGPLPPTFRNSSRPDDPVSGHYPYRVPEDFRAVSLFGFPERDIGHVEMVQPHHRYLVCWPSIHPITGEMYRWYRPDGTLMPEGEVPSPAEIPWLPTGWLEAVRHTAKTRERVRKTKGYNPDRHELPTYDVIAAMTPGVPSTRVAEVLAIALQELRNA